MNKKKLFIVSIIVAILVFSFLLRLWPLQVSHWWDETVYLQNSEVIFSGRANFDEFWLRPPMLSIIFAGSYFIYHHLFTAAVMVALLGTLGVFFVYLLGKELFNERVGILAALLYGFSPFLVNASHWIMATMPSMTFLAISFYILLKATKKNNKWLYLFSGIIFTISMLIRFTSIPLLAVVVAYAYLIKESRKGMLWFGYGLVGSMLPYLIWVQIKYGFFLSVFLHGSGAVSDQVGNVFYYFIYMFEVFSAIIIVGFILYIIFKIRDFKKKKLGVATKNKSKLQIFFDKLGRYEVVLYVWIIIFFSYMSITPHKEPRYILPIAVPLVLLAAKGFDFLLRRKRQSTKVLFIFIIFVLAIVSFWSSFTRLDQPLINTYEADNLKASKYLVSLDKPDYVFYANNDWPVYAYYTGLKIEILENWDEYFYEVFPNNMPEQGFFVYYKNVPKEPSEEWLDSEESFTRLREFGELVVYEYIPATS